jgi:hypothetical protein
MLRPFKLFIRLLFLLLFASCHHKETAKTADPIQIDKTDSLPATAFTTRLVTSDSNLTNTSGRQLFVLYNSIVGFLPRTDSSSGTPASRFATECMICEPLHVYNDHLVFAGQLEIFSDRTSRTFNDLPIPPNSPRPKRFGSNDREDKPNSFKFSEGTGRIEYIRRSCNDAALTTLTLTYKTGQFKLKNILNANFFEFDMNKDGRPEQYILATRNCSQELAILKIE